MQDSARKGSEDMSWTRHSAQTTAATRHDYQDSAWKRWTRGRGDRRKLGRLRRFSLIAAIYLVFVSCLAATTAHVLHNRSQPVVQPAIPLMSFASTPPKYLVLMVLDGARPDYLDATSLPHLDQLRASGAQFTNAITGILEAETPSGHATIATGSRPDHSGILGFDWGNANNSRTSLFNPDQMGALEQIIQDAHAPTLGGLYKQKFPTAKVVAISGHKYYAAAPLGGPNADAIMYYQGDPKGRYVPVAVPGHMPPASLLEDPSLIYPSTHLQDGVEDNLATKLALKTVATMHPRMLLINYPEFDWPLGHVYGGSMDPAKVVTDMQSFDTDLGKIEAAYRKEGILNQTLFVITADHGMMPISRFVPASLINDAISKAGTTAPDIASATGDFIWLADPAKAQAVAQNVLNAKDPGIQSAYYLTTTQGKPAYVSADSTRTTASVDAANQYLLGALMNGHEPSVVVFGNEGTSFADPKTGWKADHGGASWQSQNIPLILAGPGIRAGVVTNNATQLDDVAPTVLTAMGVTPTGMEGHVLTDALIHPAPTQRQARSQELTQMSPILSALDGPTEVARL